MPNNDRNKLKTVITVDVHGRDVIENFVRENVLDEHSFNWECQLRFYWLKDLDNLYVMHWSGMFVLWRQATILKHFTMCHSYFPIYLTRKINCPSTIVLKWTGRFEYGYEYMGLNGRLVITPLTDRIHVTLTHALSMKMGCSVIGPATTGKTETIKDLAKILALFCVVTNCTSEMDLCSIGTIITGLSQCGAWGCFSNFHRIQSSALSVVSTLLYQLKTALVQKQTKFYVRNWMKKDEPHSVS